MPVNSAASSPSSRGLRWVDTVFVTLLGAYVLSGPLARDLGAVGFIAIALVCALYLLARRGSIDIFLLILGAITVLYGAASAFNWLDRSWARYYVPDLIIRQAVCVPAFALVFSAVVVWCTKTSEGTFKVRNAAIVGALAISALVITAAMSDRDASAIPNLINPTVLFFLAAAVIVLQIDHWGRRFFVSLIVGSVLVAFSQNAQTAIASALIVAAASIPHPRLIALFVLGLSLSLIGYIPFSMAIFHLVEDPNTALRILIWNDAFDALADTWGVGVGFGGEAVKNAYAMHSAQIPFVDQNIMLISTHNSFVFLAYRLGVVSLLLFVAFLINVVRRNRFASRADERLASFSFSIAVLSLSVNVALESPLFMIGIAACLALTYCLSSGKLSLKAGSSRRSPSAKTYASRNIS